MNGAFTAFLSLPERDRRDVFAVAAVRLDTLPSYVEKDFWVCLVLDLLFHGLADGHPNLLGETPDPARPALRVPRYPAFAP